MLISTKTTSRLLTPVIITGQTKGGVLIKRIWAYFIPLLVIGLFIFTMEIPVISKKPIEQRFEIQTHFNSLEKSLKNKQWVQASNEVSYLQDSFKNAFKILQFGAERDEMKRLLTNLARIQGFIRAEDNKSTLGELYEAKEHWNEIGK